MAAPEPHLSLVDGEEPGVTPPSAREGPGRFLADVLVQGGFLEEGQVESATQAARTPGKTLGGVLVDRGLLSEDQLARAEAERFRLDHVDLERAGFDPAAVVALDQDAGRRYAAIPFALAADGTLRVAVADPGDWLALNEIGSLTGRTVRPAVGSRTQIMAALDRYSELADGGAVAPAPSAPAVADGPSPAAPEASSSAAAPASNEASPSAPAPVAGEVGQLRAEVVHLRALVDDLRTERASDRAELHSLREHVARMTEQALTAVERLGRSGGPRD